MVNKADSDYYFFTGQIPDIGKPINLSRKQIRDTKIVLLDELDYLITKDQSVLYNLFEWPQRKNANLIVVSVANTLDLPETFMARISSRIGNTRLVFTPYTSAEIKEIIEQRVSEVGIFDANSLNFISKKVALISSDIRKTLMICRQAVEKFKEQAKSKSQNSDVKPVITVDFVAKVFDNMYRGSPMNDFINLANDLMKNFLTEMYQEMKFNQSKIACYRKVYERYRNSSSTALERYTAHEMLHLVKRLKEKSIIETKHNHKTGTLELILQCNLDEIAYALKDDPYFSKKVAL